MRVCANCGRPLIGRSDKVYCSPACRQAAHRASSAPSLSAARLERIFIVQSVAPVAASRLLDAAIRDGVDSVAVALDVVVLALSECGMCDDDCGA